MFGVCISDRIVAIGTLQNLLDLLWHANVFPETVIIEGSVHLGSRIVKGRVLTLDTCNARKLMICSSLDRNTTILNFFKGLNSSHFVILVRQGRSWKLPIVL